MWGGIKFHTDGAAKLNAMTDGCADARNV